MPVPAHHSTCSLARTYGNSGDSGGGGGGGGGCGGRGSGGGGGPATVEGDSSGESKFAPACFTRGCSSPPPPGSRARSGAAATAYAHGQWLSLRFRMLNFGRRAWPVSRLSSHLSSLSSLECVGFDFDFLPPLILTRCGGQRKRCISLHFWTWLVYIDECKWPAQVVLMCPLVRMENIRAIAIVYHHHHHHRWLCCAMR